MFGKAVSATVIALVVCCPMICGSLPLLHHHADSAPAGETPHAPHDSCTFDQCFCSGPSVPTHGASYNIPVPALATFLSLCDGAQELMACSGYLAVSDRPPRSADTDRSPRLLI
jgi:hypothetical protein